MRKVRSARARAAARARALAAAAVLLAPGACRRAPSRQAALEALERSPLSHDTATIYRRVWKDGPPWFSCAEVIAKFDGHADSAVVRDQVGNWRPLVVSGWVILRDTSAGVVSDPGWCVAHMTELGQQGAGDWIQVERDSFPTGHARRGWTVPVGHQRLTVTERPTLLGKDTADVSYVESVTTNRNGAAMGANHDSVYRAALLVKSDAGWRVVHVRDAVREARAP